MMNSIYI